MTAGQSRAELRLPTRPLQEDNQIASNGQRHSAAQVLLYECQCQIMPAVIPAEVQIRHHAQKSVGLDTYGRKTSGELCTE